MLTGDALRRLGVNMARHGKLTMRTVLLAPFLAGTMALAASPSAKADQGCGPGWWRGPWGHCRDTPYSGNLPGGGVGTNVGESYWNDKGYGGKSLTPEQKRRMPAFLGMTDCPGQPSGNLWFFQDEEG